MSVFRPRFVAALFALLMLLPSAPGFAAMAMPPDAAAEFPPYPGSTVAQVIQVEDTTIVILDCGAAPLTEVDAYYTALLQEKGYTVTMTNTYPGGTMHMAERNGLEVMIDIGESDGTCMATLNLTGEIPVAGDEAVADSNGEAVVETSGEAVAAVDLDAEMAQAMPPFPGSQTTQSISDAEEGLLVMLDCGAVSLEEVYAHYKFALLEGGYAITDEIRTEYNLLLGAERPGFEAVVDIRSLGEGGDHTVATLRLAATSLPEGGESDADSEYGETTGEELQGGAPAETQVTDVTSAAADSPIWEQVSPRPEDAILDQYEFMGAYVAQMLSQASFTEVMDYYEQELTAAGWKVMMHMVDGDSGMMSLSKGDLSLMVGPEDDPPSPGTGYTLVLRSGQ